MKYIPIFISLLGLLSPQILAQEVDFSKSYTIIPEPIPPTAEFEPPPPTLQVGGVKTTTLEEGGELITFHWLLSLGFNPDDISFHVNEWIPQNRFEPELLQRRLHGTVWRGDYKTVRNLYSAELRIKSVQGGFIGGEIIHTTIDKSGEQSEPSGFLHVQAVGTITTQYLIDQDGELVWVDVSIYHEIVAEINTANTEKLNEIDEIEADNEDEDNAEKKENLLNEIISIPEILEARQLIRLKRSQSLDNPRHPTSRWGSNNEYRLTLENDRLFGNVGTPPESYGGNDGLTGIGEIELTLVAPEEIAPEPPTLE